jgi:2-iminobutanoate/2-iminopropanoate deaminase/2-aminomuconate deaminase
MSDINAWSAPVHPKPERADEMPYAPGIYVPGGATILFLAGQSPSPQYHQHPHVPEEHVLPHDIKEQTRRCLDSIHTVLEKKGMSWRNVVKVTKYMTDMRDADEMHAVMNEYFGDWKPASTLIGVHSLSAPGARVELDMIAIAPPESA